MKIRINMKSTYAVADAVSDAVENSIKPLTGLSEDEMDSLRELREAAAYVKLEKWIKYKEYITVEFDLDARTATVVPVGG